MNVSRWKKSYKDEDKRGLQKLRQNDRNEKTNYLQKLARKEVQSRMKWILLQQWSSQFMMRKTGWLEFLKTFNKITLSRNHNLTWTLTLCFQKMPSRLSFISS